jgi:hypothetical protein
MGFFHARICCQAPVKLRQLRQLEKDPQHGGMKAADAKRLKELERENRQSKTIVADQRDRTIGPSFPGPMTGALAQLDRSQKRRPRRAEPPMGGAGLEPAAPCV